MKRGQDAVCASHGICAVEDIQSHHRPPRRRCRSAYLGLHRFVSRYGVLAIDVARVFTRHRGLPDVQSIQTVPHGLERRTSPIDAFGRTEPAGLAHLSRAGDALDSASPRSLRKRIDGTGARCDDLRTGFDHHRPVLIDPAINC
jgi:hypothetical protein